MVRCLTVVRETTTEAQAQSGIISWRWAASVCRESAETVARKACSIVHYALPVAVFAANPELLHWEVVVGSDRRAVDLVDFEGEINTLTCVELVRNDVLQHWRVLTSVLQLACAA